MDTATRVQILDEAVYISYSANTPDKGMYSVIVPQLSVNSMADWDI